MAEAKALTGKVISLDHVARSGAIQGDDGRRYPFRRAGMVLWLEFDRLRIGTDVVFTAQYDRAINVARAPAEHRQ